MPMFVCGTLTMILLLELAQHPSRALRALAVFMTAATLLYAAHCAFFCHETQLIPLTDTIYNFCNPLVFPLYYVYVLLLTSRHVPLRLQLLPLLPGLCCGGAVGLLYLLMTTQETSHFIDSYLYRTEMPQQGLAVWQAAAHTATRVLFCVQIPPILWQGFRRISRYDNLLEHYLSSPEAKRLTWVKLMLIVFTGTAFISIASSIIGRHRFTSDETMLALPSLVFSLLLFAIGYVGLKQQGIEELLKVVEPSPGNNSKPTVGHENFTPPNESYMAHEPFEVFETDAPSIPLDSSPAPVLPLGERIEQLVRGQQLFLDPQLKLTDLVQRLNTNRNYVYQAINIDMQMSFSEYVNRMRVDYAEQLIASHPDLSMQEVASRSGFASTVSFYRNFKAYRGHPPKSQ